MEFDEFKCLVAIMQRPGLSQRAMADECRISLGTANAIVKKLKAKGLVDGGSITDAGLAALAPYKVRNAVIMAAGISSRFAPISYERPKGVLKVRGEVLIERQIRQLQAAGIDDITVVVGYKKEEFFYLEDEFGVKIVVNDEYAKRNNNSTIKKVEGILGNTYICSSDDYFSLNPFESYVFDSYYAAEYRNGPTDEYCLITKGKGGLIVGVDVGGGSDSWVMLGHAYWDEAYSRAFCEILDREYDEPETAGKLWEDIYAEHVAELPMRIRKYPSDAIWEFDSLDELRGFDPYFIANVDSGILDNICATLGCTRDDVKCFVPIKQGLTNLSVRFEVGGEVYVYRHPGAGTSEIISRESEAFSQGVARELGIDRTFVFEDPATGWKISRYIDGCVPFDYHDAAHVEQAMEIGRKLHGSGAVSPWTFDVYQKAVEIIGLLGKIEFTGYAELAERAEKLDGFVNADGVAPVLCHNDFYAPNFLVHEDGMDLIDWEYSAMSDYASDLGTFICCSDYGIEEAQGAVRTYFGREPSREEMRHCMAYVALSAFYWFVWALYKDKTGDPVGEWLYLWYRMAGQFGKHAEALYAQ